MFACVQALQKINLHGRHFLHQIKVIGSDGSMAAFDLIAHIHNLTVVSPRVCVKTEVKVQQKQQVNQCKFPQEGSIKFILF